MSITKSDKYDFSSDADRIRYLMDKKKFKSQTRFAQAIGESLSFVNDILHNRKKISKRCARAIRSEFGVSLEWIQQGEGIPWQSQMLASEAPTDYETSQKDRILNALKELLKTGPDRVILVVDDEVRIGDIHWTDGNLEGKEKTS